MQICVPSFADETYGQMGKDIPISAVGSTTTPFVLMSKHFVWREEIKKKKVALFDGMRFSFRYPELISSHGMTRKMQKF